MEVYLLVAVFILIIMIFVSKYLSANAVKPLEYSLKQQKQFIADISHELKTPLAVINANLDLISSRPDTTIKENKKWIDNNKSELFRMNKLIQDMIMLAKTDNYVVDKEKFEILNFSDLVDNSVLSIEALAFEKNIELRADIEDKLYVLGDSTKLKQLIMILLENAIKYSEKDDFIEVCLNKKSGKIILNVTNSGNIISEEKAEHIFDRFYRADASRSQSPKGYGLGLSIAKNIVRIHEGEINLLFSNKEKGTCFSVTLPLAEKERKKENGK